MVKLRTSFTVVGGALVLGLSVGAAVGKAQFIHLDPIAPDQDLPSDAVVKSCAPGVRFNMSAKYDLPRPPYQYGFRLEFGVAENVFQQLFPLSWKNVWYKFSDQDSYRIQGYEYRRAILRTPKTLADCFVVHHEEGDVDWFIVKDVTGTLEEQAPGSTRWASLSFLEQNGMSETWCIKYTWYSWSDGYWVFLYSEAINPDNCVDIEVT